FPGLSGMAPGDSTPARMNGAGVRRLSAAPGVGDRPVCPHAPRRRMVLTKPKRFAQNGSSERTYDTPTFGRKNHSLELPNDELASKRAPTVVESRSRHVP